MTGRDNRKRLYELAEQDSIYQIWKRIYEESEQAFCAYADRQAGPVRNILYSYAQAGRLMMQRMTNIACTCMKFPEEQEEGAE